MMSSVNESGVGGESSFDYRSLLPTRYGEPGAATSPSDLDDDIGDDGDEGICGYFPAMTWRERLLGCATCMIAGYLLSFGSFFRIKDLLLGDPIPFVMNATIGNIIALAGSFFLKGPRTQFRQMWHDTRRNATAVYLGSLFLTLFVAFVPVFGPKGLYLVVLMLAQYASIMWYTLSYIPYAREAVTSYVQRRFAAME